METMVRGREAGLQQLVERSLDGSSSRGGGLVEEKIVRRTASRARATPSRCCSPSDSILFQCASSSSRAAQARAVPPRPGPAAGVVGGKGIRLAAG